MAEYLNKFLDDFNKEQDLANALEGALTLYIQKECEKPSELKSELEAYIKHLKTASLGSIVDYQFKHISRELKELRDLLTRAQLIEDSKMSSHSPLVSSCENEAAALGNTPEAIYTQAARLERAFEDKKFEPRFSQEIQNKILEWQGILYEKFAVLILDATNLRNLRSLVDTAFKASLCEGLPQLQDFRHEIDYQIEFLENQKFFEIFFSDKVKKLSMKYDFVYTYNEEIKSNGTRTPTLRATLINLFYQMIYRAYDPNVALRFKMMRDRNATLEEVFTELKKLAATDWEPYQGSDLREQLDERLQKDEADFKCWQEISGRLPGTPDPKRKPLHQLYSMKFAGDPDADPRDLLRQLPSPVKRKAGGEEQESLAENVTTHTASTASTTSTLATDETLDGGVDDDNNAKSQRKRTRRSLLK